MDKVKKEKRSEGECVFIKTPTSVAEFCDVGECVLAQSIHSHQCPVALPMVQSTYFLTPLITSTPPTDRNMTDEK